MTRAVALAGLAAALACGCVLPSREEAKAENCVNAVASFDQQYCTNIIPMHDRYQEVEGRHYQLAGICTDPVSKARLDELAGTCVESYRFAKDERDADEDKIRTRYARQVKALKADPAYTAALDAWRAAHDEAEVAARDYEEHGRPTRSAYERRAERSTAKLRLAEDQLREVIARHGIDPAHSSVLGVW
jgi:hypothetical protein